MVILEWIPKRRREDNEDAGTKNLKQNKTGAPKQASDRNISWKESHE